MGGTERDLLGLREELVNGLVENHLTDDLQRNELLGPDLGSVEDVEVEVMFIRFGDDLNAELPLGICARLDGLLKVFAVEIFDNDEHSMRLYL